MYRKNNCKFLLPLSYIVQKTTKLLRAKTTTTTMMHAYSIRRFLAIISVIGTVAIVNVNAFSVGSTNKNNSSARSSSSNSIGDNYADDDAEPQQEQQEQTERNFIEITSLNVQKQSLPASFIESWPTWVLETDGSLERIPDSDDNNGFVSPTSIDSLWQPIDLIRPKMKLALGVHIRNGSIRHVFPALDISYDGSSKHRNRGMCSIPRAYTWVDFGFVNSMGDYNRYELRVSSKKNNGKSSSSEDENENEDDDENEDEKWQQLLSSSSISDNEVMSKAIERAVICLAENDGSINDLDGSHIIHVILNDDDDDADEQIAVEIPKSNHELKVSMVEKWGNNNKIENESLDEVEVGILQVNVMTTMSGSESEYLPDVYKPLYNDESLRNPLYKNYKKNLKETKQAQAEAAAEEVQAQKQDTKEEL
jgi:hypothetical protein